MKMRKFAYLFVVVVLTVVGFTSCEKDETEFIEMDLVGKWKGPYSLGKAGADVYYVYNADKTGKTWDVGDDVQESEAQTFTWTLVKSTLTESHKIEISQGKVPRVYEVVTLTSTTLTYVDNNSASKKSYTFTRVNK